MKTMTWKEVMQNGQQYVDQARAKATEFAQKPAVVRFKDSMVAAVKQGTITACEKVDGMCMVANTAAVDFLVKYPGIAMTLSPSTLVRLAVKQHYESLTGTKVTGAEVVNTLE